MNADDWLSLNQDEREDYLNEKRVEYDGPDDGPEEHDGPKEDGSYCGHSSHDYNLDMERFECCDARSCQCPCAPVPE